MAISSESAERGRQWQAENGYPFPLLSDAGTEVIRAYGVFHEDESKGRAIARPSTFVLDGSGRVVWKYVGARASDRPKLDRVLAALS